jgi:hypothetical protein
MASVLGAASPDGALSRASPRRIAIAVRDRSSLRTSQLSPGSTE